MDPRRVVGGEVLPIGVRTGRERGQCDSRTGRQCHDPHDRSENQSGLTLERLDHDDQNPLRQ